MEIVDRAMRWRVSKCAAIFKGLPRFGNGNVSGNWLARATRCRGDETTNAGSKISVIPYCPAISLGAASICAQESDDGSQYEIPGEYIRAKSKFFSFAR